MSGVATLEGTTLSGRSTTGLGYLDWPRSGWWVPGSPSSPWTGPGPRSPASPWSASPRPASWGPGPSDRISRRPAPLLLLVSQGGALLFTDRPFQPPGLSPVPPPSPPSPPPSGPARAEGSCSRRDREDEVHGAAGRLDGGEVARLWLTGVWGTVTVSLLTVPSPSVSVDDEVVVSCYIQISSRSRLYNYHIFVGKMFTCVRTCLCRAESHWWDHLVNLLQLAPASHLTHQAQVQIFII